MLKRRTGTAAKTLFSLVMALAMLLPAIPVAAETPDGQPEDAGAIAAYGAGVPITEFEDEPQADAYRIYVAPNGSDTSGDGSQANPYQSLDKARLVVREMPKDKDIVVEFADGFYRFTDTVYFDDTDSGNENSTIFYQAAEGAQPVFSGGAQLQASWAVADNVDWLTGGLKAYKTTLVRNEKLRAIYVNGERASMTIRSNVSPAPAATQNASNLPVYDYYVGERELCAENGYDCGINTTAVNNAGDCPNPDHGPVKEYIWANYTGQVGATMLPATIIPQDTRNPQNIELSAKASAKWVWPLVCVDSVGKPGSDSDETNSYYTQVNLQMPFGAIAMSVGSSWGCQYSRTGRHTVYNVFENLANEGEFYFDQAASELYYIPRAGENINTAEVVIPDLVTLIDMSGSYEFDKPLDDDSRQMTKQNYVEYITFKGIHFSFGDWNLEEVGGSQGYSTVQGVISNIKLGTRTNRNWHDDMYRAYDVSPAMFKVNTGRYIRVLDGAFKSSNVNGIHFENDVHDSEITGNHFYQVGHGGAIIGSLQHIYENDTPAHQVNKTNSAANGGRRVAGPEKEKFRFGTEKVPHNIYVTNNFFNQVGFMFHNTNNITAFFTQNLNVLHNQIYEAPYGAMDIGWGWCDWDGTTNDYGLLGMPTTTSRNNTVSYNRVEEYCWVLDDSGGIYTLGQQGNDDWTQASNFDYNFISATRDGVPKLSGGWVNGFHPDEGSRFISFTGNVTQNVTRNDYELNNFARKGDMKVIKGFTDMTSRMSDAPRLELELLTRTDRVWPQSGHDVVLNSGLEDKYVYMVPEAIMTDTMYELASDVSVLPGTELNRRGLLQAEDTVWLVPADTSDLTGLVPSETVTTAPGNIKTIAAPQAYGDYKLYIQYADGTWSPASEFTLYVAESGLDINVVQGEHYSVSKMNPLVINMDSNYSYTLNGAPMTAGANEIAVEGEWELAVFEYGSDLPLASIAFSTYVSDANMLLPYNVTVSPGGQWHLRMICGMKAKKFGLARLAFPALTRATIIRRW